LLSKIIICFTKLLKPLNQIWIWNYLCFNYW